MADIFTLFSNIASDMADGALNALNVAGEIIEKSFGGVKDAPERETHPGASDFCAAGCTTEDAQGRALLMRPDNIGKVTLAAVQVVSTGGIVLIMGKKRKFIAVRGNDGTVGVFEFRFPLPDAPSYEVGRLCIIGRVVGETIFPVVVGQGEKWGHPLVDVASRMRLTGLIVKNFAGMAHGNDVAEFDSLPRVYINDEACNEADATPTTSIERPDLGAQGQKSNPRTAHGVIVDDDSDDFAEDFAGSLRRILTAAARAVGDDAKPDNSTPADNVTAASAPVFDEAGYYMSGVAHASSEEDNCLSAAGDLTDQSVDGGKQGSHLPLKTARNTTAYDVSRMFNDRRDGVDIAYAGAVALSLGKTGIIACVVALAVADMAIANGDGDRTFTDIVPTTYSDLTRLLSGAEDSTLESIAVILNDTAIQQLMGMSGAQIIQNALDDIPSLIKRAEARVDSTEQEEAPL